MIQRIQSLYLLIVTILLICTLFLPIGYFVDGEMASHPFRALGVKTIPDQPIETWGLFALLFLSTIVSVATIFLFKNRILQIRMTTFNCLLIVGFYIVYGFFVYMITKEIDLTFRLAMGLSLPLISLILNYLAIRAIGKDEFLVKAADRIR